MVSKAPPPSIPPEDLIAIRDGEKPGTDISNELADNLPAQRQLLESRLLSLALSLASGKTSKSADLDTDELLDYVSGDLRPEAALALERRIRGDHQAFARLIEAKEAFFGQERALTKVRQRPHPEIQREVIGTLLIHVDGPNTQFRSQRARGPERLLVAASMAAETRLPSSADFEREQVAKAVAQITELQEEIQWITKELRQSAEVLRFDGGPKTTMRAMDHAKELAERVRQLSDLTRQLEQATIRMMRRASDPVSLFDYDERMPTSSITWETATAFLEFTAGHREPGELALTIRPTSSGGNKTTYTWVVRGVDFKVLKPGKRPHQLGRVRQGALLIIDRGFGPTEVLQVQED